MKLIKVHMGGAPIIALGARSILYAGWHNPKNVNIATVG